jgi:hypothetical protein
MRASEISTKRTRMREERVGTRRDRLDETGPDYKTASYSMIGLIAPSGE